MEKYIYNENNGLWYELVEDYYIPCLRLPPEENKPYVDEQAEDMFSQIVKELYEKEGVTEYLKAIDQMK
jgi:hypothetical protein